MCLIISIIYKNRENRNDQKRDKIFKTEKKLKISCFFQKYERNTKINGNFQQKAKYNKNRHVLRQISSIICGKWPNFAFHFFLNLIKLVKNFEVMLRKVIFFQKSPFFDFSFFKTWLKAPKNKNKCYKEMFKWGVKKAKLLV